MGAAQKTEVGMGMMTEFKEFAVKGNVIDSRRRRDHRRRLRQDRRLGGE
jgi:hypothetical protein